jgi:hypothetical protein
MRDVRSAAPILRPGTRAPVDGSLLGGNCRVASGRSLVVVATGPPTTCAVQLRRPTTRRSWGDRPVTWACCPARP